MPPLVGSAIYRGAMLSGYEYTFTYITLHTADDHFLKKERLGFVRLMVPVSVVCASLARGVIEGMLGHLVTASLFILLYLIVTMFLSAPFEYAKLMGQTNEPVVLRNAFRGLHWQLLRTTLLLLPVFTTFDYLRRKTTILSTLAGNFVVTGGVVGLSYACSWPVETLKNLVQAGKPFAGASIGERVAFMGGPRGLFRGMSPGATGGGLRNACGIIAMIYAQQVATYMGLRDPDKKS
jgi:hypothetical protein